MQRAQEGDQAAFGALVAQFQDLALGTAFGWQRDYETARGLRSVADIARRRTSAYGPAGRRLRRRR